MSKKLIAVLFCFLGTFTLYSSDLRLGVISGITGVNAIELSNQVCQKEDYQYSLLLKSFPQTQELLSSLLKNEVDFAVLPVNIADSVLEKLPESIKILAAVQNINLCMITTGKKVKKLEDLNGKNIFCPITNQSVKDALINKIDSINKDAKDSEKLISYDFSVNLNELSDKLKNGEIEYAVIPQSYVEVIEKSVKIKICFTEDELLLKEKPLMYLVCSKTVFNEDEESVKIFLRIMNRPFNI